MTIRLDKRLAKDTQYSRNKICQLIKDGCVTVNDKVVTKLSTMVDEKDYVVITIKQQVWESRGAYKLLEAIKQYHINLKDKVCLDIGCSKGGFTHVMLYYGAKKVYAVDVGSNQFSPLLLDERVVLKENTHFCHTKPSDFEHLDFIACDVSFISATKIIKHCAKLFNYPHTFVCLIKPQFELTKEILDKCKGKIPEKYHNQAISSVCNCAKQCGYDISKVIDSPILGAKSENKEFLVRLTKK